jgi:integrase
MFGVCAALAAIELEGAPFRKSNALDLTTEGKPTTFFLPTKAEEPRYTIIIPNALLKNGDFLTLRSEELPPITIEEKCDSDHGVRILTWYFKEIRPLFPDWQRTSHLFVAPRGGGGRLPTATFDRWLLECSAEIGLPMTPHNFRHGYVSLQYNDDRSSLPELAILLGDAESTLRKHYAFIDRMRTARDLQENVRQRRAKRVESWKPVLIKRAA